MKEIVGVPVGLAGRIGHPRNFSFIRQ